MLEGKKSDRNSKVKKVSRDGKRKSEILVTKVKHRGKPLIPGSYK